MVLESVDTLPLSTTQFTHSATQTEDNWNPTPQLPSSTANHDSNSTTHQHMSPVSTHQHMSSASTHQSTSAASTYRKQQQMKASGPQEDTMSLFKEFYSQYKDAPLLEQNISILKQKFAAVKDISDSLNKTKEKIGITPPFCPLSLAHLGYWFLTLHREYQKEHLDHSGATG
jgi:hypothetical protein